MGVLARCLREVLVWVSTIGLHVLLLSLLAHFLFSPATSASVPQLVLAPDTEVLVEIESVEETAATPSVPTAQPATAPESLASLSDPLSTLPPLALEPPHLAPLQPQLQPPLPLPLPSLTPEDQQPVQLPEIALPPMQSTEVITGKDSATAGQTAHSRAPQLVSDLSRLMKHYPIEARRKQWEGTVTLRLTIDAQGTLEKVEVVTSSGFPVLDKEAQKMLKSARFSGGPGVLIQAIEYKLK